MAFIDVLEQILHCLDARACYNINVAVVSHKQTRVVRDHPSIVQIGSSDPNSMPIVPPPIDGIRVSPLLCGITKISRIMEPTLSINHARTTFFQLTTGSMHHVFDDQIM